MIKTIGAVLLAEGKFPKNVRPGGRFMERVAEDAVSGRAITITPKGTGKNE